jgi:hypothetical protein
MKIFLLLTQAIAQYQVLVSAYFGGSAQLTMLQVASELNKDSRFNVTVMVNNDTRTNMTAIRLPFT